MTALGDEATRLPCKKCGASILPLTAERNNGLCAPCKGGYRVNIEAGRRWREEQKLRESEPDWVFWKSLVERVGDDDFGFGTLSEPEKHYFAVCMLEGEVYDGGFEQFFSNSSGEYYRWASDGLTRMRATNSLNLLVEAKQLLFGSKDVPTDWETRQAILRDLGSYLDGSDVSNELDKLDKLFYDDLDDLGRLLRQFGKEHQLWTDPETE